jgi:hypothetical protein
MVTELIHTINFSICGSIIATFGIISNIINITVFIKQGFGDTVNVSLFALAMSDLSSLLILQWINLLKNPLFFNSGVPLIINEFFYLTGGHPHGLFVGLTSWITVYITLQRCLCVLIPLKVKTVVTPKLTVIVLATIFFTLFASGLPEYLTAYIDWKFDTTSNRSLLGLLFTEGRDKMAILSFTIAAYTQIISFLLVVIFTTILVIKIKQKVKWRSAISHTGTDSSKGEQNKDSKTVVMIILIAVIFGVCYIPMIMTYMATSFVPEFSIVGRYHNIFLVSWSFAFLFDSINSSVNIFVYYTMSSKYRATCISLLKKHNTVV